jgi:hypothetical protein
VTQFLSRLIGRLAVWLELPQPGELVPKPQKVAVGLLVLARTRRRQVVALGHTRRGLRVRHLVMSAPRLTRRGMDEFPLLGLRSICVPA